MYRRLSYTTCMLQTNPTVDAADDPAGDGGTEPAGDEGCGCVGVA